MKKTKIIIEKISIFFEKKKKKKKLERRKRKKKVPFTGINKENGFIVSID